MLLRSVSLACLLASLGCAGVHPVTADESAEATAAEKPKTTEDDKMICRLEYDTGSHIPERICRYKDESDTSPALPNAIQRMQQQSIAPARVSGGH